MEYLINKSESSLRKGVHSYFIYAQPWIVYVMVINLI